MKRILFSAIAVTLMAALATGCKTNSTSPTNPTGNPPVINSFTATPGTVNIGDSATLSWSITNSPTTVTIDNAVGDVTNLTSFIVFPWQTTTYTLTAKNSDGQVTKTVTVNVLNQGDPGAPPIPLALTANPGNPGIINLTWSVSTGAASYIVERRVTSGFVVIATPAVNSYTDGGLFPGATYTYRVRAVSAGGARSGYSNFATAIAPGTAPIVNHVTLIPTAPPALQPQGTIQFTAAAFDASGNNLNFAQNIFTWNSSAPQIVSISGTGLATAGSQQGMASITASIGGVPSNAVSVNVSLQKNHILVIFNPTGYEDDPGFAIYTAALSSFGIDYLTDNTDGEGPTTIQFAQIKDYDRVFYCTHFDNNLHPTTTALLQEYAAQAGKRLILMGGSDLLSNDAGFMSFLGITDDGWGHTSDLRSTFTGQANTAMAGFSFMRVADFDYTSELTLDNTGGAIAAIMATDISDPANPTPVIAAAQSNVGNNSKVFYCGFVLENVQADQQTVFMTRLINNF